MAGHKDQNLVVRGTYTLCIQGTLDCQVYKLILRSFGIFTDFSHFQQPCISQNSWSGLALTLVTERKDQNWGLEGT